MTILFLFLWYNVRQRSIKVGIQLNIYNNNEILILAQNRHLKTQTSPCLKKNFFFPLKISSMMGFSYLNSLCSHTFHYNVIVPPTQHSFSHISRNDILFCVISTTNSNIELKETDLQGNLFNTCLYLFAIIIVIYNITGTC